MPISGFLREFRQSSNRSLQRKLLFWSIGFWVVSISILSLTSLWVGQNEITRETQQRNVQLASIVSRDINAQLSSLISDIRTFAYHMGATDQGLESQAASMLALRLSAPQRYRSIYYFDKSGNLVLYLTDPLQNLIAVKPAELISRPAIALQSVITTTRDRVSTANIYISDVDFSSLDRSPVFYAAARIMPSGSESRVVVLELDLSDIWHRIDLSTVGKTGFTYAVSRDGLIIAHHNPSYIGRWVPAEIDPVLRDQEGFTEYLEPFRQVPVFAAYSPVRGSTGWGIVFEQEKSEAQAPLFRVGILIISLWIFLALLGTLMILMMIRSFTRPIARLTRTTQTIARTGNLSKTGMEQRTDEVGQLSQAFDQMIERLQTTEGRLAHAAADERTRLARELHDAVSQTLFSASIIAEVIPRLWIKNPEEARKRLEEVRQLTRGALAEMRTLLLELRPAALAEAEIGDLLRQLGESISGRSRIPVTVTTEGHCAMPTEVKVALYRIVQEALNNMAKHSGARQAAVQLTCQSTQVSIRVSDNGVGFDSTEIRPDSLGLGIMRERAGGVQASITIQSQPGQGTEVIVVWKNPKPECDPPA